MCIRDRATVTRVDPEKGIVALDLGKGGEAILPRNEQRCV